MANISPATSTITMNRRSRNRDPYARSEPVTLTGRRRSTGRVSGRATNASTSMPRAMTASTTKMPRHEVRASSALPSDGARIGATPSTSTRRESS